MNHTKKTNNIETPFFIYDELLINSQISKFLFSRIEKQNIHFSLMANNNIHLLTIMKSHGIGVFVSSITELQIANKIGFSPCKIIFCSSNLKLAEIEYVIKVNPIIIADSVKQLKKYLSIGKLQQIGVRISFASNFYKKHNSLDIQRQGLSIDQVPIAIDLCENNKVKIIGIHSYLGTNILNMDFYKEGINELLKISTLLKNVEFIDLSGGFGLDYLNEKSDFDISVILAHFEAELLKNKNVPNSLQLKIEPGRYIIGPAGKLICSVIEVLEKDGITFIGVDTNLANFPRPYIYKDYHLITICDKQERHEKIIPNVYIVGNTAKSDDFLAQNIDFSEVQEGDKLCIHYAGAYCYSMSSNFCAQLRPAEYLLTEKNEIVKIREEETLDYFLRTQNI